MSAPLLSEDNSNSDQAPVPQRNTIYNSQPVHNSVAQPAQRPRVYAYTPKIVYGSYRSRQSIVLGTLQVVIGVMAIILNSVAISYGCPLNFIGTGIWGGILFIICGSFGIAAAVSMSKCKVITFMVLCIISAVGAGFLFMFSIIGLIVEFHGYEYYHCRYRASSDVNEYGPYYTDRCKDYETRYRVRMSMNIILNILAVLMAVACIWGSVLGCKVSCCGTAPAQIIPPECIALQGTSQYVVLSQQPGGQMVASYSASPYPTNQMFHNQHQMGVVPADSMQAGAVGGAELNLPPMYAAFPPPYAQEKVPLP